MGKIQKSHEEKLRAYLAKQQDANLLNEEKRKRFFENKKASKTARSRRLKK